MTTRIISYDTRAQPRNRHERGFMLVEVLVAMLVFALGVLTIVGLQAAAVQQSAQAQHRATATLLANDLIGRMWVTDRQHATLSARFATGGADYNAWHPLVVQALPAAAAHPPLVTVVSRPGGALPPPPMGPGGAAAPSSEVTVRVRWQMPQAAAGDPPHEVTVVARIR
jgi:type IV pilus assembly protein PilV